MNTLVRFPEGIRFFQSAEQLEAFANCCIDARKEQSIPLDNKNDKFLSKGML